MRKPNFTTEEKERKKETFPLLCRFRGVGEQTNEWMNKKQGKTFFVCHPAMPVKKRKLNLFNWFPPSIFSLQYEF